MPPAKSTEATASDATGHAEIDWSPVNIARKTRKNFSFYAESATTVAKTGNLNHGTNLDCVYPDTAGMTPAMPTIVNMTSKTRYGNAGHPCSSGSSAARGSSHTMRLRLRASCSSRNASSASTGIDANFISDPWVQ
ncbi:MAG: hypothetical protein RLZZ227_725 [Pseudomonadota bacterium]|jgi:hypothetical protein